jgi:hypothetical protein
MAIGAWALVWCLDFSAGTGMAAAPFAKVEGCRVFHNFHMRAIYVNRKGRVSF